MPTTVQVNLGDRSYPIHIGMDIPLAKSVLDRQGNRALVVTDANVEQLHGEALRRKLKDSGLDCVKAVVPAGENSKSLETAQRLYQQAALNGIERSHVVVALGGGMIGDLAGYVAATYQRGIRLLQIPTTLLAMVDSSVGGKTGVNLEQGKNLVGAFHQPVEVDVDLRLLQTLPQREYVSGLAEVIKYGIIWDAEFFALLEQHADAILTRDPALLERIVARCCEIKAEVVAMDEREIGPRAILNFGHTLGHAMEKIDGYGRWLHGEAVSIGMRFSACLSARVKGLPNSDADRIVNLLERVGLPVVFGNERELAWDSVWKVMQTDKKTFRRRPRFVLVEKLGAALTGCDVPDELLAESWHVCCK